MSHSTRSTALQNSHRGCHIVNAFSIIAEYHVLYLSVCAVLGFGIFFFSWVPSLMLDECPATRLHCSPGLPVEAWIPVLPQAHTQ